MGKPVEREDDAALQRRIQTTLKKRFGLQQLREGQQRVILRVLRGLPTLAVMPTGAGKSLCYQLPALLLPGRTLVVSPLIALMKDQCDKLRGLGIAAVQLNSAIDAEERHQADAALADGSARIVFTTPEQLRDPGFVDRLGGHPISLGVVDEVHCISQWGHDFRPDFLEIGPALKALEVPVLLALTATADDAVADEVSNLLGIPKAGVVHTGAYRPNLRLAVETVADEDDKRVALVARARSTPGAGIVYTATVKAAEELHGLLAEAGESVALYHGRLPASERHAAQDAFMHGERRVMVATNAFGLGIDKADIRFVLHHQMPASLNAYYQEAGRAGRDGETAQCTLFFLRRDKAVQQFFMAGRYPSAEDVETLYRLLHDAPPADSGWTLDALQLAMDRPRNKLQVAASLLRRRGVLSQDTQGRLAPVRRDLSVQALRTLIEAYRDKREHDHDQLEGMVAYAQSGQCRWASLLQQLDESVPFERCDHCDNCERLARHVELVRADAAESESSVPAADAPRFRVGDRARARRYGAGTVVAIEAQSVTLEFEGGIRRNFDPGFVAPVAVPRTRGKTASAVTRAEAAVALEQA